MRKSTINKTKKQSLYATVCVFVATAKDQLQSASAEAETEAEAIKKFAKTGGKGEAGKRSNEQRSRGKPATKEEKKTIRKAKKKHKTRVTFTFRCRSRQKQRSAGRTS